MERGQNSEGHCYYFNVYTHESRWERPSALGGPFIYQLGEQVEVWSNSAHTWGRGEVTQVQNDLVTVDFSLSDGQQGKKRMHSQHRDLRHAPAQVAAEGRSPGPNLSTCGSDSLLVIDAYTAITCTADPRIAGTQGNAVHSTRARGSDAELGPEQPKQRRNTSPPCLPRRVSTVSGPLDNEGRPFDLSVVVVNFSNAGATYGAGRLKRDKSKAVLFDYEGVSRCVHHLSYKLKLSAVGVVFENQKAIDNHGAVITKVPGDIAAMCRSFEEAPRIADPKHK